MTRFKVLAGLAAALCALMVAVTPASGWFRSLNGHTTGKSTGTGGFVLTLEKGGKVTVTCNDFNNGVWTVQSFTKQSPTKEGPHLQIEGTFEGKLVEKTQTKNCEDSLGGQVEPVPVSFQIKQPTKGQTKGLKARLDADIHIVQIGTACTLTAPSKENQELKEVIAVNNGKNVKVTPSIEGLTITVNKGCEELGLKGSSTATFTLAPLGVATEEELEVV